MMLEHEIRTEAARERAAHLSRNWSPIAPRHRVRLTLGRWLIGAGRRLTADSHGGQPGISLRA
jgi:hypothetical protein